MAVEVEASSASIAYVTSGERLPPRRVLLGTASSPRPRGSATPPRRPRLGSTRNPEPARGRPNARTSPRGTAALSRRGSSPSSQRDPVDVRRARRAARRRGSPSSASRSRRVHAGRENRRRGDGVQTVATPSAASLSETRRRARSAPKSPAEEGTSRGRPATCRGSPEPRGGSRTGPRRRSTPNHPPPFPLRRERAHQRQRADVSRLPRVVNVAREPRSPPTTRARARPPRRRRRRRPSVARAPRSRRPTDSTDRRRARRLRRGARTSPCPPRANRGLRGERDARRKGDARGEAKIDDEGRSTPFAGARAIGGARSALRRASRRDLRRAAAAGNIASARRPLRGAVVDVGSEALRLAGACPRRSAPSAPRPRTRPRGALGPRTRRRRVRPRPRGRSSAQGSPRTRSSVDGGGVPNTASIHVSATSVLRAVRGRGRAAARSGAPVTTPRKTNARTAATTSPRRTRRLRFRQAASRICEGAARRRPLGSGHPARKRPCAVRRRRRGDAQRRRPLDARLALRMASTPRCLASAATRRRAGRRGLAAGASRRPRLRRDLVGGATASSWRMRRFAGSIASLPRPRAARRGPRAAGATARRRAAGRRRPTATGATTVSSPRRRAAGSASGSGPRRRGRSRRTG